MEEEDNLVCLWTNPY